MTLFNARAHDDISYQNPHIITTKYNSLLPKNNVAQIDLFTPLSLY